MTRHKQEFINLAAKYCKLLGIKPLEFDAGTLEQRYRAKVWEMHPDRGGKHEDFILLKPAYLWLKDNYQAAAKYAEEVRREREQAYSRKESISSNGWQRAYKKGKDYGISIAVEFFAPKIEELEKEKRELEKEIYRLDKELEGLRRGGWFGNLKKEVTEFFKH